MMRDRMERFVLLPFTAGCISESSVAVGMQHARRASKMDVACPTPMRTLRGADDGEDSEEEDDVESLSSENDNLKSPSSHLALPRFQKLFKNFKNFSQFFAYKDGLGEEDVDEVESGMDIGLPTDVKHVTHIGLDGCASSILSSGWNVLNESESTVNDLPAPFPLTSLELSMAAHANKTTIRSLLETK